MKIEAAGLLGIGAVDLLGLDQNLEFQNVVHVKSEGEGPDDELVELGNLKQIQLMGVKIVPGLPNAGLVIPINAENHIHN